MAALQQAGHGKVGCLSGTAADPVQVPGFVQGQPLVAHRRVELSASVLLAAATGSTVISVAWFDQGRNYIGQDVSPPASTADGDWQTVSVSGSPPAGATEVQLSLKSSDNIGSACFDDVHAAGAY